MRVSILVLLCTWLTSVIAHCDGQTGPRRLVFRGVVEVYYSMTFARVIFRFVHISPTHLLLVSVAFVMRTALWARATLSTTPGQYIDLHPFINSCCTAWLSAEASGFRSILSRVKHFSLRLCHTVISCKVLQWFT